MVVGHDWRLRVGVQHAYMGRGVEVWGWGWGCGCAVGVPPGAASQLSSDLQVSHGDGGDGVWAGGDDKMQREGRGWDQGGSSHCFHAWGRSGVLLWYWLNITVRDEGTHVHGCFLGIYERQTTLFLGFRVLGF